MGFLLTSQSPELSIIICAHNPRPSFIEATLAGLRSQTLDPCGWELCVVDNVSVPELSPAIDLSWHPQARIVREEALGLTQARLRGIAETVAPVLVFVDDDNVLDPDYLHVVRRIAEEHANVGTWGGRVILDFETPPPDWTRQHWPLLAHRDFESDQITRGPMLDGPMPVGAGLCVRADVARAYARRVRGCAARSGLDRRGETLSSSGDSDLALTACDLGMEIGCFRDLRLKHLIPADRLKVDYLARLSEELLFSSCVLRMIREPHYEPPRTGVLWRLRVGWTVLTKFGRKRQFHLATKRAHRRARQFWESGCMERGGSTPSQGVSVHSRLGKVNSG